MPRVIAVVDDDASIRAAIDSLLRSRGYTVCTFASAAELLRSPQLNDTSCVITDVRMPDMSGVELQTVLRSQAHSVPFIFVTAFPDNSACTRALRDGAACFLSKPFDSATLIKCVEGAIAARELNLCIDALQQTTVCTNLRRIDSFLCSNYSVTKWPQR